MKTTVIVNVRLHGTKRARCMKTYDLPFKLQKGDSIQLNNKDLADVKEVYVDLGTHEITVNLESIMFEKDDDFEYDETIKFLKKAGWKIT